MHQDKCMRICVFDAVNLHNDAIGASGYMVVVGASDVCVRLHVSGWCIRSLTICV